MDTQEVKKQSVLMHPTVSFGVIALFLWLGFNHASAFLEGEHYRHLLFTIASILIVLNRVLWLPQLVVLIERYSSVRNVRTFLPLIAILFVGAFVVL